MIGRSSKPMVFNAALALRVTACGQMRRMRREPRPASRSAPGACQLLRTLAGLRHALHDRLGIQFRLALGTAAWKLPKCARPWLARGCR
jgi:hypothetical protein